MTFAIYVNNGFNYEFFLTIDATSVYDARKKFKHLYAGDHRTEDFRVSRAA